jgi:radical SAM superfamily enzyme YgiQ (UPF0313 family)
MRVLLVNPEFPDNYWSLRHALPFVRRRCGLPPLGLITLAALLPGRWELRLADLNVEPLSDDDLGWADTVMLTAMITQRESLHEVLGRCRRLGIPTVVGGPYATALPAELGDADHVAVGEAEELAGPLAVDLEAGRAQRLYRETRKPDLTEAPVPRFDLLPRNVYHDMALQFSRGCPFRCEFCDIIVMYGRRPRTKTAEQVIAELEAIRATGFSGSVFFVDDNFIGNKKAVKAVLPEIAAWRERVGGRMSFYTEASINLADDDELVRLMTEAGFRSVFIGIESPSEESLRETRKVQNLERDLLERVHSLLERGLGVSAGFILGFDHDGADAFDRMIDFVQRSAIPHAMVGVLMALPHTPLYHRLEREGRLRAEVPLDNFGLTNVVTAIPDAEMISGYRRVMQGLYEPEAYLQRCRENVRRFRPAPGPPLRGGHALSAAARVLWAQGVRSPYRAAYWRYLGWALRQHRTDLLRAFQLAAVGHHYITYTRETVLPRLAAQAAELTAGAPRSPRRATAAG